MDIAARHHLAVTAGPGVGWVVPLCAGAVVVGRGEDADLPLPDPALSRRHLRVRDRGGRVRIQDLRSVNGTRLRLARGQPAAGAPPRPARWTTRAGRRWRPLPVGSRILAGSSVLELRAHPGMVLPADPEHAADLGGGLLGRLMLPLLMSVSTLPLLLGGGGGRWRVVLLIALPVVLIAAILWPALRERARRLRRAVGGQEPEPPVPQPIADPAALLAAAGAPVVLPEEGPRWEIGRANVRAPVPRRPDGLLRGRVGRRAERMRFVPMPAPGSGLALVGAAESVTALGRWIALRHAAMTAERVQAPWPELAGLAKQRGAVDGVPLLRVVEAHSGLDFPTAEEGARYLVLAAGMAQVPRWCSTVVEVRTGHDRQVGADWARAVVAELNHSPDGAATVPSAVHLAELLPESEEALLTGWAEPAVRAPLGMNDQGPVWLDLAEHGPHALVAGTTGSGKSELLLAWILALAHQGSPADTSFVLFDYKGGATFTPLRELAHVAGVLTDLEESATARALTSLQAELRARERALAAVGAHDLAEQRRRTEGANRLGRLLVVVDEFRVMADTHPEQLEALVRLAAQGRSLGIHLVLATQRPGGAITPDMRANLTVRLCLRVLEETDSLDMLGDSTAARLPRIPGRAVLRTEIAQEVQAAWCGTAAEGWVTRRVTALNRAALLLVDQEPWRRALRRPWAPPLPESWWAEQPAAGSAAAPDHALASADAGAAAPDHGVASADAPTVHRPLAPADDESSSRYRLPWALLDLPDEQRLGTRCFTGGTLLVSGPPGSGRSTVLRALIEAALRSGTCVHVLAEDAEAWPGHDAPAAGTWCPTDDPRRCRRLLERLLAGSTPGLLVIDDVEAVATCLDEVGSLGDGTELLQSVLRRSRRLGLDVVLTAAESSRRWAASADQQLLLCPRDPADAVLAGAPRGLVASGWPPGRGVLLGRGDAWVAQVALAAPDPQEWQPAGADPLRLAPLPVTVRLAEAPPGDQPSDSSAPPDCGAIPGTPAPPGSGAIPGTSAPPGSGAIPGTPAPPGRAALALGRGGDDASWLHRTMDRGDTWLVCGPPGSGRSSALAAITAQLTGHGWQVFQGGEPLSSQSADALAPSGRETGAPQVLVIDDADRLPGAAAEHWAAFLDERPGVCVLGSARAESLASSFHPLAMRLREPDLSLVLADPRPAHASLDLRSVQDPVTRPGRGVLVDSTGAVPLQVTTVDGDSRAD
ncbi:FtsK/SpoIIIE domain-containing protein [Ruania zhangjianzhongii]|uniref:FtsK/SpoIIIE domain-containing protein n=1 Tax=Ruania zhangjianzhongii TaxID=2603206 RepID=UPI0011C79E68|nr:FtsK/SpoIIIE domain-containing protein [Ruania zhangjianzhongii]